MSDLARRVEEIRASLDHEGKLIHDLINAGIVSLENLRELREKNEALVDAAAALAAAIAARSAS